MPIVIKYDDPALVATLAANAGQYATNEQEREQARAQVGQVMGMNAALAQQGQQAFQMSQANARAAGTIIPGQGGGGYGGPGGLVGGGTINYPPGTTPPPGEQFQYGINAQQRLRAGMFDQQAEAHKQRNAPVYQWLEQGRQTGAIDPQSYAQAIARIDSGEDGFSIMQTIQQSAGQQQQLRAAAQRVMQMRQAGQLTDLEANQALGQIEAGANPFEKGLDREKQQTASGRGGGEDPATKRQEQLHKFRLETIDDDIAELQEQLKAADSDLTGGNNSAQVDAIKKQLDEKRKERDRIRGEYGTFLEKAATAPAPSAAAGGQPQQRATANGIPQIRSRAEADALPSGTQFIGPDGKPWVKK